MLIALLLLFGRTKEAESYRIVYEDTPRLASAAYAPQILPKERDKPINKPLRSPVRDFNCFNGSSSGCVLYLRSRGFCVPRTPTGGAGSLPVVSTELPTIGEEVYLVSYETPLGHVSRGYFNGKELITTVDSAGAGRVIPLGVYKGWY